jgi:hypothetical protein
MARIGIAVVGIGKCASALPEPQNILYARRLSYNQESGL